MKIQEFRELLVRAAAKHVTVEEAEYFADEVVETTVRKPPIDRKYQEHLINDIKLWNGKPNPVSKVIDLPGFTRFDFDERGPSLKI